MSHFRVFSLGIVACLSVCIPVFAQPLPTHNLRFDSLPKRWDEALPLGNALIGCLVWQKEGRLRLSLDRADLWDLRPMPNLHDSTYNYKWIAEQVRRGEYGIVQEKLDAPYEREPAPSKLPGAALEFDLPGGPDFQLSELDISNGLVQVARPDGIVFKTFVHAEKQEGWFRIESGFRDLAQTEPMVNLAPQLLPPKYKGDSKQAAGGSVAGDDLARLGYTQTEVEQKEHVLIYHQPCWGGFSYQVAVAWRWHKGGLEGVWSISSHFPQAMWATLAEKNVRKALHRGFAKSFEQSARWWAEYWSKSSIRLPDADLERQYYLESYKFGCLARSHAPMISLQGIWTADNGRLPPWKGDFHHDLNTELSYWHASVANHPDLAYGYLRHIESNDAVHRAWTQRYFGTGGLNVPGVETLLGEPMGGWIQYSCSPTTSAWLAQHFYLHWRYTMDERFLKNEAWPFLRDVSVHLEALTKSDEPTLTLPLSSSPEVNDNSIKAWFVNTWTNYDLALARFVFEKTAEFAEALGKSEEEINRWKSLASRLPAFALTEKAELKFAPSLTYDVSHRHFSHLMAIHPLGLLDWHNGDADRKIIQNSIQQLSSVGSDYWTGYSFAWLANLQARARDGAKAREALRIFAGAFVSKNSFHLNGDQSGHGYSKFTYRPFTLEGNFAFAAGVQEMLLQSQGGRIVVFPALPPDWADVEFKNLRAEGAFLVNAVRKNGQCERVEVFSEKGGLLNIELPPGNWRIAGKSEPVSGRVFRGAIGRGKRLVFDKI